MKDDVSLKEKEQRLRNDWEDERDINNKISKKKGQ